MARPLPQAQRNLTLTEELEKLEQSITLTLQEIDSNFSRAHRIVTTSILPVVEQYAEHSRDVWDGAKFWKQFFEASANVSLSGYEEQPNEDTEQEPTVTEGDTTANTTHTTDEPASYETASSEHLDLHHGDEDLDLSSLTLSPSHSTPRAQAPQKQSVDDDATSSSIPYPSPYETLRQEVAETDAPSVLQDAAPPTTPGKSSSRLHDLTQDISVTPTSSPFIPPASHMKPSTAKKSQYHKPTDPLLHRMLDKTYRVQATPLGKGYGNARTKFAATPKTKPASRYNFDESPISSPEPEAPQLHAEIFSSPLKGETPATNRKRRTSSRSRITPKPGISVLTPGKKSTRRSSIFDSDDDFNDDDELGYSPPKTMQFHIPQSRLMKTPAKEASKRIVSDLLATAGGTDDVTDDYEEQSPSVIRRAEALEDETF